MGIHAWVSRRSRAEFGATLPTKLLERCDKDSANFLTCDISVCRSQMARLMNRHEPLEQTDTPLSRISTNWDLLAQAHGGFGESSTTAQHTLLLRYGDAVYRYLLQAVRAAARG